MPLSESTRRAVVTALNQEFDIGQVDGILRAMDALQISSPPLMSATPNFDLYIPGLYYDAAFSGSLTSAVTTGTADTIDLAPFFVTSDLFVNEFALGVVTGVAATNARVVIYTADSTLRPDRKVYESVNLSTATSATSPAIAAAFTFIANQLYWIGVHYSGAPTLRGIRDYCCVNLGYSAGAWNTGGNLAARKTVTFGSAPAAWSFTTADLTSVAAPSVRFRVA